MGAIADAVAPGLALRAARSRGRLRPLPMTAPHRSHDPAEPAAGTAPHRADLVPTDRLEGIPDAALAALRGVWAGAGFDGEALADAERIAGGQIEAMRGPAVRAVLATRDAPRAALLGLFASGGALGEAAARALLGEATLAALERAGLLAREAAPSAAWRTRGRLLPFEGLWIWSDHPDAGPDAVMGPGITTQGAVRLLPERLAGDALDVGCGAGSLALVAARRGARSATGVDLAPRAVALARFNARLNGVAATFACGDLFDPVRGRAFDLVIAQPPYVVKPGGIDPVTYLHGGPTGDAITRRLLGALGGSLRPGGRALVVTDLWLPKGERLHERLRADLGDPALDLVTLAASGPPPATQAVAYASLADPSLGERYARAAEDYVRHLLALEAQPLHLAIVVRRRAEGAPRGITSTVPVGAFGGSEGRTLDDVLAAIDLVGAPDAALLAARVRPARRATWVHERAEADPSAAGRHLARFARGALARDQELSESSLAMLATLGASSSVADAVESWAAEIEATPDEVQPDVLAFVREGLGSGLIEPESGPGDAGRRV
jgi:SAM-dependent methyltransferase